MSTSNSAYRLTLYAPRSVDPTEATILTPPGGAAHSDPFKVTTLNNLAGWKPYLGFPRGRTGRVDMLERKTDVGTMSFEVTDAALTPGTNAIRWMTTFLGNANGDPQLGGLKCFAEESTDGGTTWAAFWTGYVKAFALNGRGTYTLTVRDMLQELTKLPLFQQPPHASIAYAGRPQLMPVGIVGADYGVASVSTDLGGTVGSPVSVGGSTLANVARVVMDSTSQGRRDNFITQEFLSAIPNKNLAPGNFGGVARAHLAWNAGANQGDFKVGSIAYHVDGNGHSALTAFLIQPLDDPTDTNYAALPANATAVTFHIFADYTSVGVSLFIDVANPLTLLADILAGKFSQLYRAPDQLVGGKVYGDVRRSFTTSISATTIPDLPPARFRIDEGVTNALDWIAKNLLKPYGLALVCDGAGAFSVIDLRPPQSLAGLVTITDADVALTASPKWDYDRDAAIFRTEGTLWEDLPLLGRDTAKDLPGPWPSIKDLLLKPIDHPVIGLRIGSGDFGEQVWKMDGGGYRFMGGDAAVSGSSRDVYLTRKMADQFNLIRRPYAFGSTTAVLPLRRTATINALTQGQVVQVNVSTLPNPTTGQRGGTRICRAIELTRNGATFSARFQDLGVAAVASVPTLGAPALGSDPRHTATITVTLNASLEPAEVRYAFTASGAGAAPADTDAAWHAYPLNLVRATGSITLTELTPGLKVWIQARTFPDDRASLKMPSAWVTSTGLTLTAYGVPSAVVISNITATTAKVSWTNALLTLLTEVWLRSPDSGAYTRIALLLPGSNFYNLWGLAASTAYGVLIQYRSLTGIVSGSATGSFSTTSGYTIPIMPPPPRRRYL